MNQNSLPQLQSLQTAGNVCQPTTSSTSVQHSCAVASHTYLTPVHMRIQEALQHPSTILHFISLVQQCCFLPTYTLGLSLKQVHLLSQVACLPT